MFAWRPAAEKFRARSEILLTGFFIYRNTPIVIWGLKSGERSQASRAREKIHGGGILGMYRGCVRQSLSRQALLISSNTTQMGDPREFGFDMQASF
jgi:hypothetical protein